MKKVLLTLQMTTSSIAFTETATFAGKAISCRR